MTGLLDTNIIIDFLRAWPPAIAWLRDNPRMAVTRLVWLEVLQGAPNKVEQKRAYGLLSQFPIADILPEDFAWAIQAVVRHGLSHHIMGVDALIAAPAARLGIPLYTHDLKHIAPILGELAQKPY